jgi:NADPH:quinone reductase-like Zn-dependent oxidoreductase
MQEYMVLTEEGVVKAPRGWSPVQASTLPCAAVTAWNAVVHQGKAKEGDVVIVQGTGGVSLFALLFAKMQQAEVIATSSSDEKLERLKALGADHVVNYNHTPDWQKTARKITDKRGVDLVINVGGTDTLSKSILSVRAGGTVALVGALTGPDGEIDLIPVMTQDIRLQGITAGSRDLLEEMVRAIELREVEPPVDENLFAFEEVGRAIKSIPEGRHFGKVCSSFDL